jgi:hypothetical protein
MMRPGPRAAYLLSLPERGVRAIAATAGGALYEMAHLLLPRLVRQSRFYEATARNALRIAIELLGGVEGVARQPAEIDAGEVAKRKIAGNIVELGSIAAFGFSPLWLIAAASDVLRGSRLYLDALVAELVAARVLSSVARVDSFGELLGALERTSGRTASLIDIPPLELAELRRSYDELRSDARSLPSPPELAAAFRSLELEAEAQDASLLELSTGIGMAFLVSARKLGRAHVIDPYREDWRPLREEGAAAYARRISGPYRAAAVGHFDTDRDTLTERTLRARGGS